MKSYLSIAAVVLGALLVGVVVAEERKIEPYDAEEIKSDIKDQMSEEEKWLLAYANSYKKEAATKENADEAAKFWLASQLVTSLNAIRFTTQLEALDNLVGNDYLEELYFGYYTAVLKAHYKVDDTLEKLVKLGSELKGSTISKDVVAMMKRFEEHRLSLENKNVEIEIYDN